MWMVFRCWVAPNGYEYTDIQKFHGRENALTFYKQAIKGEWVKPKFRAAWVEAISNSQSGEIVGNRVTVKESA